MFIRHPKSQLKRCHFEPQLKRCHFEPQLKRCHFEPQLKECHVLNPYPEPQLKEYVLSHNSRNTSKSTFEISPKPYRPRTPITSKTYFLPLQYCLVLLLSRQAKHTSRPSGGGNMLPSAKHL